MRKKVLFYFLLVLVGCITPSEPSSYDESKCNTIRIKKKEAELPCDKIIADIDILPLGPIYKNYVGDISKIIATPDRFIVFDRFVSKMIFLFDRQGKFVNYVGKKGRGPEEYVHINDVSIVPGTGHIAVLDQMLGKVNLYDQNGKFVETRKTKYGITLCQYLDKNQAVGFRIARFPYGRDETPELDKQSILILDEDLQKVKHYAFTDPFLPTFKLTTDKLYQLGDKIYYFPNLSNSIYLIQQDSIRKLYQIDLEGGISRKRLLAMEEFDESMYEETPYFLGECLDMKNYLFLGIVDDGEGKMVIYDKSEGKNYQLTPTHVFPLYNYILNNVFYISENQVVGFLNSGHIMALKDSFKTWFKRQDQELLGEKKVKMMEQLLSETTEDSNPVLFIFTLKNKIE